MNTTPSPISRLVEVASSFGVLGISSFGGPTAHLGYFREEFVNRRKWLSATAYAELVALCQLLPGPASSQVGMALGFRRAGYAGMVVAWLMFTAPSAILLAAVALGAQQASAGGVLAGLLAAAVGVVAHAVYSMAASVGFSWRSVALMAVSCAVCVAWAHPGAQILVLLGAGVAGLLGARPAGAPAPPADIGPVPSKLAASLAATVLVLGLSAAWVIITFHPGAPWWLGRGADYFYAGSLVFGGGHVVLPMLAPLVTGPGGTDSETFVAGYSAAQAVPGPLFTLVSYLGAAERGIPGAIYATVVMFAPAALLVIVGMHYWSRIAVTSAFRRALAGINAAVVGLLAAAWITPIFSHGVLGAASPWAAAAIAAVAFAGLGWLARPPWQVIVVCALLGFLLL